MDEGKRTEPGAGRAGTEHGKAKCVSFEESERRLLELANKYRKHGPDAERHVPPDERAEFGDGWQAQSDYWEKPTRDYVAIINDINAYLALRYKGVPDIVVASAAIAAGNHLMHLCSQSQIDRNQTLDKDDIQELTKAIAQRLGLAMSEPAGHG